MFFSRALPRILTLASTLALITGAPMLAQITGVNNATSTPVPGIGHDYIKMLNETVNPANGSVSLRIAMPTPPGRGLTLPFSFAYDSNGVYTPFGEGDPNGTVDMQITSQYLLTDGWSYTVPVATNQDVNIGVQPVKGVWCQASTGYVFQDAGGARNSIGLIGYNLHDPDCTSKGQHSRQYAATDLYQATLSGSSGAWNGGFSVADADGRVYNFGPFGNISGIGCPFQDTGAVQIASSIEDRNGNIIKITVPAPPNNCNGQLTVTDTLGRTLLSSSGFGATGNTVTVSGLPQPYTVTWGTASVNFTPGATFLGGSGCSSTFLPVRGSIPVITAITLPNGQKYQFFYDATYGLLNKVIYPTGGYVSYTWAPNSRSEFASLTGPTAPQQCDYEYDSSAISHRYTSYAGVTIAEQQDFSYSTTWNPNVFGAWSTKQTTVTTHDLIRNTSFQTTYTYLPVNAPQVPGLWNTYASQIPLEQTIVYKDTNGNTLRTVNKAWFDQYELKSQQTVLENNLISEADYTYGGGAQVTEQDDYDFGSGARGPLLRKTVTNYQGFSATPIFPSAGSIFDRPCQTIIYDSSGTNRVAETDYLYDGGTTLCGAAGTPSVTGVSNLPTGTHDETNYGATSTAARGNATTVIKQCFQGSQACASGNPASTSTFDETGQVTSITDANNHTTQFSYADSYTVLSGGANVAYTPSANTNAYLTKITNPLSQTQNFTYDFNNGQLTIAKDQNNLTTSYVYNDSLARPTLTTRPDNGTTTVAYNDTALTVTTSRQINTSQTVTTVALSDGVGHVKHTQLTSDPQGTIYTDTAFDGLGRVYTVSNPYRTGSDPTTSLGTTTYYYDALGRKCLEVPPDGTQPSGGVCPTTQPANTIFTTYSGNTTTVTDQTGKSRKSVTDGLGRMTQVLEDPLGVHYETDYAYDPLGNLLCAGQKGTNSGTFTNCSSIPAGWHPRNFSYDSLSRLLTSTNPETGTITYKYDSDSNCASPSTFLGLLVSKTDARGIRTCAQYDAINRETVLNYSNGDHSITTTYDQTACLGLSTCQNIGHRTSMTDAAGSEAWSYQVDAANHRSVHVEQRTTNGITKTSTYYFDQAGNVTQAIYPTGRVVNYTYDAANRPSSAADGSNGITYAAGFDTSPGGTCTADVTCYTPQGTFYALSIGETASFTGLNLTHTYNSRLQPLEFKASSSGGNAIDITYSFVDPVTTHNAGHVYSITNNLDTTRSQNFIYDSLNRITSALTTSTHATSPYHCWGEVYNPDAWGNLQSISATTNSNYTGCSQESGFTANADGNNHLTSFSYDASGNTQNDGTNSYTWDAESQLKTAAGVTYAYDGDGRRVSKSSGKLYWYGSGGDILAETDASGNTTAEYIFFGGKRVAMLPTGGNPIYYIEDLLGTSRVITTNTGVVCYDADFYPYGGERSYTNTCPQNYKFEGKERDTETGNDDFGARYYSNRFGRWLSADWSSVPVPVPYANLTNPQTLNLYAMVADDPESFADLDGHTEATAANDTCGGQECTGTNSDPGSVNNPPGAEEGAGHSGMLGGVLDWLDVIEVSGSYGLGAESHGEAGSSEYHGGVGVTIEGTIGLGGGNGKTEVFAGGNGGLKAGSVAEGEIKAGGTLSSKEGASLNAEVRGSLGGVGGSVKLDKNGVAVTPKAEMKKDVKVGIHGHLGLGVGVNVNLSQAKRAYNRTVASAKAFGAAVVDALHSFNLPNFRISPNWHPDVQ